MKNVINNNKCTVTICTDYVIKDSKKTKEILEQVSRIVSNSYIRMRQVNVS